MNRQLSHILLILVSALVANLAHAATNPFDYHIDAKMVQKSYGPVDKAYGYMNVVTDNNGNGVINVMFSNGSQIDWARFNANVKFLNAAGSVVKEEHFARRLSAANRAGAVEHKLIKPVTVSNFDSIQVDFYLSDIPGQVQ